METIIERVDDIVGSPLYHHTSEQRALDIMSQNKLRGSLPSSDYLELDKRLSQSPSQSAISLTRDKNFEPGITIGASWDKPKDLNVVFVLDSNKLKTRYRVEPFNYSSIDPDIFDDMGYEKNPELEERVLTKFIYPLRKYVTNIIYKGNDTYVKDKITQYMQENDITEQWQINELSDESNGVQELLDDVKNTPGLLKYLGFSRFKSLEVYIREGSYDDFSELRSEVSDFHKKNKKDIKEEIKSGKVLCDKCGWSWDLSDGGKDKYVCHKCGNDNDPYTHSNFKNIKEQIEETGLNRSIIKLFKILNAEKKNLKTRANILEFLEKALKLIGLDEDMALYYLELYVLNYRKDGQYELISKNNLIDPKKGSGKTTTNTKAWKYTTSQMPFKGSNLNALWRTDSKGVPVYVVSSYNWYPILVFKEGKWYEIADTYSSSTGRQLSNANPQSWRRKNKNIDSDVYLMTKDELDKLIKYADHETIMREKLDRFKGKETEFTSKRPTQIRTGGWGGEDAVKIKFKISSISEDNGKPLVTIDVLDVLRREGGKGIETPENYLKNEISGVTKEKVENRIIVELGNKLKEFIGSRFRYNNEKVKSTKDIEFKFNHLRV